MRFRALPLTAAVFALCLGAVAWFNARKTARIRAEHRAVSIRVEEHRASLRQLEARLAATKAKPVVPEPSAARTSQSTQPPPKRAAAPPLPPNLLEQLSHDPRLQNLKLASRRAQLAITFSPLYRLLGLVPEQIARFEQNLLRYEEQRDDIIAAARSRGTPLDDPSVRKLLGDAAQADFSAQRELLGDHGLQQFHEHERLALVRERVSGLAGAAAMGGIPFDGEQAERLTQVLDRASGRYPNSNTPDAGKIDWAQAEAEAAAFLSPAQLTIIETTEPRGPRGMGGRFMPALHAAIDAAVKADEAALATTAPH